MVFVQTPVVHVGLGKTGTTSLQQSVFPLIPNFRSEVVYNSPKVIKSLQNFLQVDPQPREEHEFRAAIDNGQHRHFISLEALTGWNPATWKERADRNLRLFGSHASIIITARPTEEWLRSVYQQKVHEGNVVSAESFFLRKEEYDRIQSFLAPNVLSCFNVDSFDLERLYQLYCDRFESVFLVPLYQLKRLDFLGNIFSLTEDELAPLRRELAGGRLHNRAYSSTAMALTFQREKILGVFGLASRGSNEGAALRSLTSAREINEGLLPPPTSTVGANTERSEAASGIDHRPLFALINRGRRWFRSRRQWRFLMQYGLDRVLPYKPYRLPLAVYRNQDLARKNDFFLEKQAQIDNSQRP